MFEQTAKLGLYRHFKGGYYFLMNVMRSDNGVIAQYVNVLHPEYGYFCRPYVEWFDTVLDRPDNYTGQTHRFELITYIDDGARSMTTDHLVRELNSRGDSPYLDYDLDGLNDLVKCRDYCIGEIMPETKDHVAGVMPLESFDTLEEARKFFDHYAKNERYRIFKRVFIEETLI